MEVSLLYFKKYQLDFFFFTHFLTTLLGKKAFSNKVSKDFTGAMHNNTNVNVPDSAKWLILICSPLSRC